MNGADWDAIVIGAGPAGSLAALLLARTGVRVALVERAPFPRSKVCGGCLNAHALGALDRAGVLGRVRALGARPIDGLRIRHRSRSATLGLPAGLAVSRAALDAELVAAAVEAGAVFVPETTAIVGPGDERVPDGGWRSVTLRPRHEPASAARARLVLAADGLSGNSLRECPSMRSRASRRSRIGVGGLAPAGSMETAAGSITMAVGRHGYVGAVEVEDGRINVAAACDPEHLKAHAGAGRAVLAILAEAGVPFGPGLAGIDWSGTIPLTRRMASPAARRLFVLGDAAGYVEPFTGEGMAWAFAAAEAAAPLASRAIASWHDGMADEWAATHARCVGREQRWCRALARGLRHPWLMTTVVTLLDRRPGLAGPVLAHFRPHASDS